MGVPQIIIDTNVVIAAARSRLGASARLMTLVGTGVFDIHLSPQLVFEYEELLRRGTPTHLMTTEEIDYVLNYLCSVGFRDEIWFHWRPMLPDPDDEFLLELAVAASVDFIVTHNVRDLSGAAAFGIRVVRPPEFLRLLEKSP